MEHEILNEIGKLSLMKRDFVVEAIDDMIKGMQYEYGSLIEQKNLENSILKSKEESYQKDMASIIGLKNDLLSSIEVETQSHKKTIESLSRKEHENGELKNDIRELQQRLSEVNSIMQALTDELSEKSKENLQLQKLTSTLQAQNDELKEKFERLRGVIEKAPKAYAQALNTTQSDLLARSLQEHRSIDTAGEST